MVRIDMFRLPGTASPDNSQDALGGLAALLPATRLDSEKAEKTDPSPFRELLVQHAGEPESAAQDAQPVQPDRVRDEDRRGQPVAEHRETAAVPEKTRDAHGIPRERSGETKDSKELSGSGSKPELVSLLANLVHQEPPRQTDAVRSLLHDALGQVQRLQRASARGKPPQAEAKSLADLLDRVPSDRGQKQAAGQLSRRWRGVAAGVAGQAAPAEKAAAGPEAAGEKRPAGVGQSLVALIEATGTLLRQMVQGNGAAESGNGIGKTGSRAGETRKTRAEGTDGPRIEVRDLRANDPRQLAGPAARRIAAGRQVAEAPVAANDSGKPGVSAEQKQAIAVSLNEGAGMPRPGQGNPAGTGSTPIPLRTDFATRVAEAAKAAVTAEPRAVFHQIVDRARLTLKSGMSEMQLDLKPESLGRVRMNLLLSEGGVQAKLTVADEGLRQFLSSHLEQLGEELRAAGINLTGLEVMRHGSGQAGSHGQEQARRDDGTAGSGPALMTGATIPGREGIQQAQHQGAVDLIA